MNEKTPPQVTVVIPVHNCVRWVADAVLSAAEQDYRPLRIVVVDDGSTDSSVDAVLARLTQLRQPPVQREPWVALGHLPEHGVDVMVHRFLKAHGPAFARNWGMKNSAEGTDIFAMLDSDDLFRPGRISRCMEEFSDPLVALVYSDYDTLREDGLLIREYKEPWSASRMLKSCVVTNCCFLRKSAIEQVGLYDEQMRVAEDYDLFIRLGEKFVLRHVPESLAYIRVGPHNSTWTVSPQVWHANWARIGQKMHERRAACSTTPFA